MDTSTIFGAGLVIFLAGTAHSVVGFGYSLFATPLLVMIGIPLPRAITLVATCSLFQSGLGTIALRRHVPWRTVFSAVAVRVAGMLVGILYLKKLAALNMDHMRLTVGLVLCALVLLQMLWKPRPVPKSHWGWAGLAFSSSGILAGLVGMGGPPLVLWLMAHDWTTRRIRGFLFAVFTTTLPLQLGLLTLTFDVSILRYAGLGLAFVPLVFLGSRIGLPLGDRMPRAGLRRVAYLILLVIGGSAVLQALLSE